MSLAQCLSSYLNVNMLIIIGYFGLWLCSVLLKISKQEIRAQSELRLHYVFLAIIITISILHPLLPRAEVFTPPAKVWSAKSIKSFGQDFVPNETGGYLKLSLPNGSSILSADRVSKIWLALCFVLVFVGAGLITKDIWMLLKIKRASFLIRKIGHVQILICETISVPFSFWLPNQVNIILPTFLVERKEDFRIALLHELQHHRHQDTKWIYVMWLLRLFCVANPVVHLWSRWISEIQEFACDETLVGRNKVESQSYARCLVEVAQTSIEQKYIPACATGLIFLTDRKLLKRRIEKMFEMKTQKASRVYIISVILTLSSLMAASALAANGFVQDRRVSLSQANDMAKRAQSQTGFQVVVNDLVIEQLNRYIGTPEGREFMRQTLMRMQNYKSTVVSIVNKYQAPLELMAIPIVESGYQNLGQGDEGGSAQKAAGLWQFIPSTARNYGLRVENKIDERLNIELNTDAAIRYLTSNFMRFKDWQLAALAYNMGEESVQNAINKTNSRDVWFLIRHGYEGDKNYLPKLMAAILIMQNPESVE